MFERFTDRARRVLVLAQEEARLLDHSFIGTEHILLGLIHESDGLAAKALGRAGVTLEAVRVGVEDIVGASGDAPSGSPPFTPRAKKVLELSLREALHLGHGYIGTEHLLLGVVDDGQGVAAQVLQNLGVDLDTLYGDVVALVSGTAADVGAGHPVTLAVDPPRCPRCRAGLADVARYRVINVSAEEPGAERDELSVRVVFCSRCGTGLGTA